MTLKFKISTLLIIIFVGFSFSQSEIDSLKTIWTNDKEADSSRYKAIMHYYLNLSNYQLDSTLNLTNYHYKLAQQKSNIKEMILALNKKANIKSMIGNYDDALRHFAEAEKLLPNINNKSLTALVIGDKGIALAKLKKYAKALKLYTKALKIYKEGEKKIGQGRMLNNIAGIYLSIENYDLALKYYNESLEIFKTLKKSKRRLAILHLNIAFINLEKKEFNQAIFNYNQALKISEETKDNYFNAAGNISIARAYYKLNKIELAEKHAYKFIEINNKLNSNADMRDINLLLAKIEFKRNPILATIKAENLLSDLSEDYSHNYKKELYKLLYDCYKNSENSKKALKMYEQYVTHNDSINAKKNKFTIIREAIKNDFEMELYETKLKNEKEQSKLKVKQLQKTFFIILLSSLLIAGTIYYSRVQNLKNKNKLQSLLNELDQLKLNKDFDLLASKEQRLLNRNCIENSINRKLNETDWKVLNILFNNPVIQNKEIAKQAFLSVDGIGSSLRRMYDYFDIKETKYKKIALINDAIKRSSTT